MMTLTLAHSRLHPDDNHTGSSVFTLPPQGEPSTTIATEQHLQRLHDHIRQRLSGPLIMTCHPHRVGMSNCVSVTLTGTGPESVNILITVSSPANWPGENEFSHPRWYISVPDSADMLYLILWLNGLDNV